MVNLEQHRIHFELEKKLARKIMESDREKRFEVVRECYDELYKTITWHQGLNPGPEVRNIRLESKKTYYWEFINKGDVLVEVGCGDGALLSILAEKIKSGIGIDPSLKKLERIKKKDNILILPMGSYEIPAKENSLDVIISSQVVEHIHPDDMAEHLYEIYKKLKKGGRYIFDTPNKKTGPHDISKYFSKEPEGFHLKEYTYKELAFLLKQQSFREIKGVPVSFSILKKLSISPLNVLKGIGFINTLESIFGIIPVKNMRSLVFRIFNLANIFIIAEK